MCLVWCWMVGGGSHMEGGDLRLGPGPLFWGSKHLQEMPPFNYIPSPPPSSESHSPAFTLLLLTSFNQNLNCHYNILP